MTDNSSSKSKDLSVKQKSENDLRVDCISEEMSLLSLDDKNKLDQRLLKDNQNQPDFQHQIDDVIMVNNEKEFPPFFKGTKSIKLDKKVISEPNFMHSYWESDYTDFKFHGDIPKIISRVNGKVFDEDIAKEVCRILKEPKEDLILSIVQRVPKQEIIHMLKKAIYIQKLGGIKRQPKDGQHFKSLGGIFLKLYKKNKKISNK